MANQWQDEDISKIIKNLGKSSPEQSIYQHVWFKIEEGVAKRQRRFWDTFIWRPWGHPVRWVALAACLLVGFSSAFFRAGGFGEDGELGSYLVSVSNTAESVTSDPGLVRVSVLLTEPSAVVPDMTVENHVDPLADDEIFL